MFKLRGRFLVFLEYSQFTNIDNSVLKLFSIDSETNDKIFPRIFHLFISGLELGNY